MGLYCQMKQWSKVPCFVLLEIIWGHIVFGGENFSTSKYVCRYCLITRNEFQGDDPNVCGPVRIIESYSSAVDPLETEQTPDVEGVKFKSVFNSLEYFNVCQPGLSYDVPLYLEYFIKTKAWFTSLNRHIKQFKYCASDSSLSFLSKEICCQ